MSRQFLSLLLSASLAGCAVPDSTGSAELPVLDGTPDGVGLLGLLNDPATTRSVLDDEVPLDARAAAGLIAHRDGPDGALGTADDDLFDDVAEVDAVKWVGEVSLARLVAFAAARGYTPTGDDLLGSFDGVPFTVNQAERVLDFVDAATETELHDGVPLDARAVASILEARPVDSMPELAALYYVGPVALQRLEAHTAPAAAPARPDCRTDQDCPDGWRCTGKPVDGSSDLGMCYYPTWPPGADASCDADTPCNPGLECLGLYAWGAGFCVPAWQRGQFTSDAVLDIPGSSGDSLSDSVVVRGLATVPVDILVHHHIRFSDPHALRITLVSVNGDQGVLWDGPAETGPLPDTLVHHCCIPSDDSVNGTWWLVIDNVTGAGQGELGGWTLDIISQWD